MDKEITLKQINNGLLSSIPMTVQANGQEVVIKKINNRYTYPFSVEIEGGSGGGNSGNSIDATVGNAVVGSAQTNTVSNAVLIEKNVTENGIYNASDDQVDGYLSVNVALNGPIIEPLSITENGTYSAPSGVDGYSPVTVDVAGSGGDAADEIIMRTISGYTGNASYIGSYAFQYCPNLTTVSFPNTSYIESYAFQYCPNLTTVSFPNTSNIGVGAFMYCSSLTTVSFPNASYIGSYAFQYCSSLTSVSFPNASIIEIYAFQYCSSLISVSFPNASHIGGYAFANCSSLTSITLPNASYIGSGAFQYCYSLTDATFPNASYIGNSAFKNCYRLISLYLTGGSMSQVPSLGINTFISTPIGGYSGPAGQYGSVYVPASLYSSFLTATNWSAISSRIVSVE